MVINGSIIPLQAINTTSENITYSNEGLSVAMLFVILIVSFCIGMMLVMLGGTK